MLPVWTVKLERVAPAVVMLVIGVDDVIWKELSVLTPPPPCTAIATPVPPTTVGVVAFGPKAT